MPRHLAALLLLLCTMFWGFAFVVQKSAMESIGPLSFAGVRYLIGGLLVLPLAMREWKRRKVQLTRANWWLFGVLCFAFFMGSWLQQAGLATTTATNGGFLTGLYVFFVPLIGYFLFRVRPHPIVYAGVPMALVGIYYLNGGGFESFNTGDWMIVISAVFWAMHVLTLGHLAKETGLPIFLSAVSFLVAGAVALGLAIPLEAPNLSQVGDVWVQLAYAAVLSTAVGFTLQAVGQQYVPPANAAIILSAESLFAALGGALLMGDRLLPVGYAGAALMFLAIVMVETVPALLERRRVHEAKVTN